MLDGRRIEGKAHEQLLWYQLREIEAARKQLLPPGKIAEREHKVKIDFEMNTRHEEISDAAIAKINELRIIAQGAATDYMKERTGENADKLIQVFYNLPRFGGGDNPSVSCADSSLYTREPNRKGFDEE